MKKVAGLEMAFSSHSAYTVFITAAELVVLLLATSTLHIDRILDCLVSMQTEWTKFVALLGLLEM